MTVKTKELTKDELERELVSYDRQKVITQCLKLFRSNQDLSVTLMKISNRMKDAKKEMRELKEELKLTKEVNIRLVNMSVWKFFIHKIKAGR